MSKWINRTVVQADANGTADHTIDFTPATEGNFLLAVCDSAVTDTTPTGWTAADTVVNNTELAVFTKTAAAGESSFTTTHNASDYPMGCVVYEFPAGSTYVDGVTASGIGSDHADGPNLTGLTGTNLIVSSVGQANGSTTVDNAVAWTGAWVEDVDVTKLKIGSSDGYTLGVAYLEDSVLTSSQPVVSVLPSGNTVEHIVFAVNVAAQAEPGTDWSWSVGVGVG